MRQTAQVRLESDPETPRTYHNCELCIVRSGKGRRPEGYVEPPLEELAKLRRQEEDAPPVLTEEDSLAAAIEAAFPSRERREEPEERRPNRRNRPRRPRMEEEETGFEQVDRRLREESRDHRNNNRRRRHRPKGKGGRPNAPQE